MEKRRGRREIEVTRRRRGEIKKEEHNLARNQIPMCSPQSGKHREVHRVSQRRRRKEIEVTRRRRGGVKRREINLVSNRFPKCSPQPETPKEIHRVN